MGVDRTVLEYAFEKVERNFSNRCVDSYQLAVAMNSSHFTAVATDIIES